MFFLLVALHISLLIHSFLALLWLCISSFSFPMLSTSWFSQPTFSTQKMGPSARSFLCTLVFINCSTFLCSGIAREAAGQTRPFETTIQKTKRKKEKQYRWEQQTELTPRFRNAGGQIMLVVRSWKQWNWWMGGLDGMSRKEGQSLRFVEGTAQKWTEEKIHQRVQVSSKTF